MDVIHTKSSTRSQRRYPQPAPRDAAYLAENFRGMKKPYVAGFYWGADG
jgi:hypothetical protein